MSTVLRLNPPADIDARACAAMRRFLAALDELRAIRLEDPDAIAIFLPEIDKADTDIALLRAGLRMKRSTADLCGKFGGLHHDR
jgi:hypothetical protein